MMDALKPGVDVGLPRRVYSSSLLIHEIQRLGANVTVQIIGGTPSDLPGNPLILLGFNDVIHG